MQIAKLFQIINLSVDLSIRLMITRAPYVSPMHLRVAGGARRDPQFKFESGAYLAQIAKEEKKKCFEAIIAPGLSQGNTSSLRCRYTSAFKERRKERENEEEKGQSCLNRIILLMPCVTTGRAVSF